MSHVFLKQQVADYDAWRPHFDAHESTRAQIGIADIAVLRDADDPNTVWLVHEADEALIEPTLSDPAMIQAMSDAGVLGIPEVFVGQPRS